MAVRMLTFQITLNFLIFIAVFSVTTTGAYVENLTDDELNTAINSTEFVLVLIYPDPCESDDCKAALRELPLVAKATYVPNIRVVQVKNSALVNKYNIGSITTLLFFRNSLPILYDVRLLEREDVVIWLENNKESSTRHLDSSDFEHLTQASTGATTGDWFILFQSQSCIRLVPLWEAVSSRLRHKLNVATVDIDVNTDLKHRFKVKKCPSAILFRLGSMYRFDISKHDVQTYVRFAEGWYTNFASHPVPTIPTPFDVFTDSVVAILKTYATRDYLFLGFIVLSVVTLVLVYIIYKLYTDETFLRRKSSVKRD